MSEIRSFRGLIADSGIETITLHTNTGTTGYKIKKLSIIPDKPVTAANECVIQIWKIPQTAASSDVDFSNNTLLAVGIYSNQTDTTYYPDDETIIFDSEVFNQDIYITHKNETGSRACNYYLELEVVKLDLVENTVATLKDIRNIIRNEP